MRKSHKFLVKLLILLILPMTLITTNPIKAKAHDAYFIQTLVDPTSMLFVSTVEHDNLSAWKSFSDSLEKGHRESSYGDYSSLKNSAILNLGLYGNAETNKDKGIGLEYIPNMVFTFPSVMQDYSWGVLSVPIIRNHANGYDSERATQISFKMTNNLNQALSILFGGVPASSMDELEKAVAAILKASGSGNGVVAVSTYNLWTLTPSSDGNSTIFSKSGQETQTIQSRMKKGYDSDKLEDGTVSPVYDKSYSTKDEVSYISMGMIGAQGMHLNHTHSLSTVDTPNATNQSVITQKFKEFLSEVVLSIRNVLGLKSLDQMIFDSNGAGTYGGIMSYGWMKVATTFHLIFQAIAWSLLTMAVIKILVQNNLATINVYSRISMMESIKKLIFTAVLLASSLLIINMLARLNSQFVSIFATMRADKSLADNLSNHSTIGTVIMSFYYLMITIYFNFVYIMRGLTVAILIATAPMFIISISFASAESKLFMTWVKEITSNIFLQSFHAFVFALILSLSTSSVGIETAVVSFSLIPLSSFFRNLITGGDTLSSRLQNGAGSGVFKAGAGLASGAMLASKFKGKGGAMPGGKAEGSPKGFNMEKSTGQGEVGDIDALANRSTTQDTIDSMNRTKIDAGQERNPNNNMSTDFHALTGKDIKSGGQNLLGGAKAGGKMLAGAALATAGVGVGMGLAMSGVNPASAGMIGMAMAGKGLNLGKSGAQDVGGGLIDSYNESVQDRNPASNGNIVNAETLQNGNTVIERDRAQLYEQEGVLSAEETEEGNLAITYNQAMFKEGSAVQKNVGNTAELYDNNKDYYRRRGVANVTRDGQNPDLITIHYNKEGKKQLGVDSMTTTERRIKEVKKPSNPMTTQFNYNPKAVVVQKRNEEDAD